jgi:hypothetical protein
MTNEILDQVGLCVRVSPFTWNGECLRDSDGTWHGKRVSLDGVSVGDFMPSDIAEVIFQGQEPEDGDDWDGKCVAVIKLKDGRLVAWETWWGPTGNGFMEDAYGGEEDLYFASDLRVIVNAALSDEGRRMAGVPEELWNK